MKTLNFSRHLVGGEEFHPPDIPLYAQRERGGDLAAARPFEVPVADARRQGFGLPGSFQGPSIRLGGLRPPPDGAGAGS